MNPIIKHIYIILSFVLVFFIVFRMTEHPASLVEDIKSENQALEIQSDSITEVNKELDKKIIAYEEKVDSIQSVVHRRNKKINELKNAENEKILSIDSLGSNELVDLFSGFNTHP